MKTKGEFDLVLASGVILGECCHGSLSKRSEMDEVYNDMATAQPYRMNGGDVCDWCGYGPGYDQGGHFAEIYDSDEFDCFPYGGYES